MRGPSNLGYAVLGVSDLDRWIEFANVLALQVERVDDGALAVRMDDRIYRLMVERGGDDLVAAGWEFEDEACLERHVASIRARGVNVERITGERLDRRAVSTLYAMDDPNGYRHEFYVGLAAAPADRPFRVDGLVGAGFKTGPLGFGHLLVRAIDYPATVRFYQDVLGLTLSDTIRETFPSGRVVDATFFHARTGRHHSLATAGAPVEKALNHFMIEVESMDDVGLAHDRCVAAGYRIAAGLGHHPNDRMFSFYVASPSGFNVEYGWGGQVIPDYGWVPTQYDKLSDWGHAGKRPMGAST